MELDITTWLTDQEILENLGQRVKTRRLSNNQSQDQLAHELGLSLSTIKSIEQGKNTSLENFIKILRHFSEIPQLNSLLTTNNISLEESYTKKQKQRARKKKQDDRRN